jgi:hypothetical protein
MRTVSQKVVNRLAVLRPEQLELRCVPAVYSDTVLNVNGATEHRLMKNGFHFESIVQTAAGSVLSRSHPDRGDINGFGGTVYVGTYSNVGAPTGSITSVVASDTGVVVEASGNVATASGNFGTWEASYTYTYDAILQQVTATGTLDVTLNGPLSQINADLTVSLIANNKLINVPLQTGGTGNTGDMRQVNVSYNGMGQDFVWHPELQPDHFPNEQTTALTLDVEGEVNIVDTLAQGENFQIAIARKPRITQTYTMTPALLTFGGRYDTRVSQDFSADNVGVLALIRKETTTATSFHFDIEYVAVPGPPLARPDTFRAKANASFAPAGSVLANDSTAFPANLRAAVVSGPRNGALQFDTAGTFTYTPRAGFVGTDTFTYRANDGDTDSNLATVTLNVIDRVAVYGTAAGSRVLARNARTNEPLADFEAFPGFPGGVAVATGDITGDGVSDYIAGAGAGGGSHVKAFDGVTGALIRSFIAFEGFNGPVSVAAGDINGDGLAEIIVGAPVNGHVKAFDGATGAPTRSFLGFEGFNGAVAVGAGDLNGDGFAELLVGAAANGHVKAFDGQTHTLVLSFLAYVDFTGAVRIAGGDTDGDGFAEIITSAGSAATHVKVFDGRTQGLEGSFIAFPNAPFGASVGVTDVNGDGIDDILVTPATGVQHVKHFAGPGFTEVASFLMPGVATGLFVAGDV